jgi:hypothetical protein
MVAMENQEIPFEQPAYQRHIVQRELQMRRAIRSNGTPNEWDHDRYFSMQSLGACEPNQPGLLRYFLFEDSGSTSSSLKVFSRPQREKRAIHPPKYYQAGSVDRRPKG